MCSTFFLGHWQPLSWLSYALDYAAWGMEPAGWHAGNLLLHALNAILVYLLCMEFVTGPVSRKKTAACAAAALFYAIHPLRVEVVAWLATRGYLLGTAFCLLTVLFYLRATTRKQYPFAALLFFTLATVSKGVGMMLPLLLLLVDWVPLGRLSSFRKSAACFVEKIPFFMLSTLTGVMAFLAKKTAGGMVDIEQYGFSERFGQALSGIWFYLYKTISPTHLSPLYDKQPGPLVVLAALLLTTVAAVVLFLFRRRLYGVIAGGAAFFLLIHINVGSFVAGRSNIDGIIADCQRIEISDAESIAEIGTCRCIYGDVSGSVSQTHCTRKKGAGRKSQYTFGFFNFSNVTQFGFFL